MLGRLKGLSEELEEAQAHVRKPMQVQAFSGGHHNVHNHTSAKLRDEIHRKGHLFSEGIIIRHNTAWTMNTLRNHHVS